jgi:hypothetical protein
MSDLRAVVFDIDGTLVLPGAPPTVATVAAVEACRDHGIACFVATARRPASASYALGPLAWLAASGVFHAGALGCCGRTGFRAATRLGADLVDEIVTVVRTDAPHAAIGIHTEDGGASFGPTIPPPRVLRQWGCSVDELIPFAHARSAPACKLAIWGDGVGLRGLAADLSRRWPGAIEALVSAPEPSSTSPRPAPTRRPCSGRCSRPMD